MCKDTPYNEKNSRNNSVSKQGLNVVSCTDTSQSNLIYNSNSDQIRHSAVYISIYFGIISSILVTLKIEYRLKSVLDGGV